MRGALAAALVAVALGALGALPARAGAARAPSTTLTSVAPPGIDTPVQGLRRVVALDARQPGLALTGRQALRAVLRDGRYAGAVRAHPGARSSVFVKDGVRWQASLFTAGPRPREVAVAYVDDASGRVTESWTGWQVAWTMARGYPGAFGRKATALWVWLPLTLLFVVPFLDRRRPWRGPALDLAALALLGVSFACFSHARVDLSVPLSLPPLLYLLGRLLWLGLRRRPDPAGVRALPLLVPVRWLAVGLLFLVGFRAGLDVANANVIDVGYSGVLGADALADGRQLWGNFPGDNLHGDTYGPIAYLAYVPFEQLLPWSGHWDDLPAAKGVSLTADLACIVLLFLLGRRLRGPELGVVLAYAWAACPFTLLTLASNSNDTLIGAFVLGALLAVDRPATRGAMVGLAGWAKFAPLALAPLLATAGGGRAGPRRFLLGLGLVTAVSLAIVLAYGGLPAFWHRTLGYQDSRSAPFSIWGQFPGWRPFQGVVQAAGILLAVAVAVVPRRRDLVGLAALSAAVLLALQLGVTYWFYLYLSWLLGPLLVAVLGRYGTSTWSIESARPAEEARTTTALTQGSSSDGSKRTDIWVRRLSMACSRTTPSTPPRAPVIPTSVT